MLSSISPNDATKISNNFESCTICELFFCFLCKNTLYEGIAQVLFSPFHGMGIRKVWMIFTKCQIIQTKRITTKAGALPKMPSVKK